MAKYQSNHFLIVSGIVSRNKKKEFEQTIKFIFNQLPGECIQRNLATDINNEHHYFLLSTWADEQSLFRFMESEEIQLIRGAYDVLGHLENMIYGPVLMMNSN
jgi:quinol monooxygenase YgiN